MENENVIPVPAFMRRMFLIMYIEGYEQAARDLAKDPDMAISALHDTIWDAEIKDLIKNKERYVKAFKHHMRLANQLYESEGNK